MLIALYVLEGFQQFTRFTLIDYSIRPPFLMGISLVHHFHSETCSVEYISPGINYLSFRTHNGLVEIKSVQVESHGTNTKSSKPNTNYWPSGKEEVK
jgi:hypothetical protein